MTARDGRGIFGAHDREVWDPDLGRPRCTANKRGTEDRCSNRPPMGGTVCRFHGARAPQTEAARRIRLLDLQDPAIARHAKILANPNTNDRDALTAIKMVYDRTGMVPGVTVDVKETRRRILDRIADLALGAEDEDG